ncbi:hypothetical protein ASPWEDRAFT_57053 [Aspergillus wentii DTO 134E9]|uniref:Short chain dehydrogenase/reductase n=1 Tax=Aspergillus wentii DTO 134E9 TaxID=1073089 RepID=A0A1L9RTL8_ASPWE|nr:uncharacterized protein ASPWEDRAFT_57053 [Aspergillus wentii DTO 134E9]OJJ38269.1 hypothetical protein ASPWEDRAFT_57053 [Aspergillus wentii DTO 134E9]
MIKRSIIITGIGLGITTHFAPHPNTHITILDVNPETASQALKNLSSQFPSCSISFKPCNVASWESQAEAFESVFAEQGRVDVVFANAGITEKGRLLPTAEERVGGKPSKPDLKTLDVNLVGVLYSIKLGIHYISKNTPQAPLSGPPSKGSIICTSSNAGHYAFPIAPLYAATKHGVTGLVRSLARSLEREQIQINALAPAVIETNIAPDVALFKSMIMTPMETVTKAVEELVSDSSLTGKVAELHGERVSYAEPQPYVDEDTETNIETFWRLGYA